MICVINYVNSFRYAFFEKSGILTIGSRLRWLAEVVTRDAAEIYEMYGIDINPKCFPVLYMLFDGSDCSVTGIAKAIGQTHPSVSNIVKELKAAGLVSDCKSDEDRRATVVALTDRGRGLKDRMNRYGDAKSTNFLLSKWCGVNLFAQGLLNSLSI